MSNTLLPQKPGICKRCPNPVGNAPGGVCWACQRRESEGVRECVRCPAKVKALGGVNWKRVPGGFLCRCCQLDELVAKANLATHL